MTLVEQLNKIQKELNAPKNQKNAYAGWNYRSCEDIIEAVKPLLDGVVILLSDHVELIGDRYYIVAEARISNGKDDDILVRARAREPLEKKGNDCSQVTGSTSSYARKYALNGLLMIDDSKIDGSKDPDSMDNSGKKATKKKTTKKKTTKKSEPVNEDPFGGGESMDDIPPFDPPDDSAEDVDPNDIPF